VEWSPFVEHELAASGRLDGIDTEGLTNCCQDLPLCCAAGLFSDSISPNNCAWCVCTSVDGRELFVRVPFSDACYCAAFVQFSPPPEMNSASKACALWALAWKIQNASRVLQISRHSIKWQALSTLMLSKFWFSTKHNFRDRMIFTRRHACSLNILGLGNNTFVWYDLSQVNMPIYNCSPALWNDVILWR